MLLGLGWRCSTGTRSMPSVRRSSSRWCAITPGSCCGRSPRRSAWRRRRSCDRSAPIHANILTGDVPRGRRGEIDGGAHQIRLVAEAAERRVLDHRGADLVQQPAGHFEGKKPGQSAFTRIPWRPHSAASARVNCNAPPSRRSSPPPACRCRCAAPPPRRRSRCCPSGAG